MNPVSLAGLARLFSVGGAALGLPALAYLVLYAGLVLHQRWHRPAPATAFGPNPDAVLTVLQGLTQVVGGAARLAGSLAQVVLDMAAAAAGVAFVLGLAAWLTGRGLQAQAGWARVSGGALLAVLLLAALVATLSLRGTGRLVMAGLVVFAVLGLQALWAGPRPLAG